MLRITCPFCGPRDEAEFTFRGDASLVRPAPGDVAAHSAFLYARANPKGWTVEWFQHSAGCRQWLKVQRHTVTHDIAAVLTAREPVPPPPEESPR